jgi:hypothetical protein
MINFFLPSRKTLLQNEKLILTFNKIDKKIYIYTNKL